MRYMHLDHQSLTIYCRIYCSYHEPVFEDMVADSRLWNTLVSSQLYTHHRSVTSCASVFPAVPQRLRLSDVGAASDSSSADMCTSNHISTGSGPWLDMIFTALKS